MIMHPRRHAIRSGLRLLANSRCHTESETEEETKCVFPCHAEPSQCKEADVLLV